MIETTFIVPGKPVAKGRPRFSRLGNFVRTHSDPKTVSFEGLVALSYQLQIGGCPHDGPFSMAICAKFPIPKSWSKKKRLLAMSGELKHTKTPDCDNLIKAICDGLNNVAYLDDSQVYKVECTKKYSDKPQTTVTISYEL